MRSDFGSVCCWRDVGAWPWRAPPMPCKPGIVNTSSGPSEPIRRPGRTSGNGLNASHTPAQRSMRPLRERGDTGGVVPIREIASRCRGAVAAVPMPVAAPAVCDHRCYSRATARGVGGTIAGIMVSLGLSPMPPQPERGIEVVVQRDDAGSGSRLRNRTTAMSNWAMGADHPESPGRGLKRSRDPSPRPD